MKGMAESPRRALLAAAAAAAAVAALPAAPRPRAGSAVARAARLRA